MTYQNTNRFNYRRTSHKQRVTKITPKNSMQSIKNYPPDCEQKSDCKDRMGEEEEVDIVYPEISKKKDRFGRRVKSIAVSSTGLIAALKSAKKKSKQAVKEKLKQQQKPT